MKHLLLAALLGATLASPALAADECACGKPGCEASCTCSQGVCPLHKPKSDNSPQVAPTPKPAEKTTEKKPDAPR